MKASASELLFPDPQGRMLSRHTPLEDVLRRALGHAGIVEGWEHVCRKQACGHAELSQKLLTTFLQAPRSASSAPSDGGDFREEIP